MCRPASPPITTRGMVTSLYFSIDANSGALCTEFHPPFELHGCWISLMLCELARCFFILCEKCYQITLCIKAMRLGKIRWAKCSRTTRDSLQETNQTPCIAWVKLLATWSTNFNVWKSLLIQWPNANIIEVKYYKAVGKSVRFTSLHFPIHLFLGIL